MDTVLTLLAALCTGITATLLTIILFHFFRKTEIDRSEQSDEIKKIPVLFRIVMPLIPNVMFLAKSDSLKANRAHTRELLAMAGYDQTLTAEQFISIRILMLIEGVVLLIIMYFAGNSFTKLSGFLLFTLLLIYPTLWLRSAIKLRHMQILKALPNVLDLLTLSVEAGRDFLTALRDIVNRRKMDPLGEELARTLHEIQLGKQRQRALKELSQRVQQPDLTSVVSSIIQADELGVSIGQLLRIQGDQIRSKRFTRAEKLAGEAPVKILFPVVVFIFPTLFIILFGPIIMQMLGTLSK